jgi:hypothetical protein
VFFAYVSEATEFRRAEELAWHYLDQAETALERESLGASLCSGFTGIAWAYDHLHRHLCREREDGRLQAIDDLLIDLLRHWSWPEGFEFLYGLTGVGVYALERLPSRAGRTMAKLVVERLAESARDVHGQRAWFTPRGENTAPEGEFNLGLAHGVPGVVGFLARAAAAGVAPRLTRPLLARAAAWLHGRRLPEGSPAAFARSCDLAGTPGAPTRSAWCYGDPGVVSSLFASAAVLSDAGARAECLRTMAAAASRPRGATQVADAGLCHGSAGLGHIFHRLFRATGTPILGRAARFWFEETLAYRRKEGGIGGFTALRWRAGEGMIEAADMSLLTGASGVGLALLAASTAIEPEWDRVLLLNTRPLSPVSASRLD